MKIDLTNPGDRAIAAELLIGAHRRGLSHERVYFAAIRDCNADAFFAAIAGNKSRVEQLHRVFCALMDKVAFMRERT